MSNTTYLVTKHGTVTLHAEDEGYRWLTEEGEDTETSASTYETAITAGLSAWPEGVVVVMPDRSARLVADVIGALEEVLEPS